MASSKHYPKGYGEGAGTVNSDQSKLSTSFDDDNWSEEGDRDSGCVTFAGFNSRLCNTYVCVQCLDGAHRHMGDS